MPLECRPLARLIQGPPVGGVHDVAVAAEARRGGGELERQPEEEAEEPSQDPIPEGYCLVTLEGRRCSVIVRLDRYHEVLSPPYGRVCRAEEEVAA